MTSSVQVVARREIKSGEEITIDYATLGYDFGDEWLRAERVCSCGSGKCRGTVTGWKDLPKKIKEEYINDGVVLKFLLKPEYNDGQDLR